MMSTLAERYPNLDLRSFVDAINIGLEITTCEELLLNSSAAHSILEFCQRLGAEEAKSSAVSKFGLNIIDIHRTVVALGFDDKVKVYTLNDWHKKRIPFVEGLAYLICTKKKYDQTCILSLISMNKLLIDRALRQNCR